MIEPKSFELASQYIKRLAGKATASKLVEYMQSSDVPLQFQTSEIPTRYTIISELEKRGEIKVIKGRHGQSHYLVFNDESVYNKIFSIIEETEKHLRSSHDLVMRTEISKLEETYRQYWKPTFRRIEDHLKTLLLLICTDIHTSEGIYALNNKIAKISQEMFSRDVLIFLRIESFKDRKMKRLLSKTIQELESNLKLP